MKYFAALSILVGFGMMAILESDFAFFFGAAPFWMGALASEACGLHKRKNKHSQL